MNLLLLLSNKCQSSEQQKQSKETQIQRKILIFDMAGMQINIKKPGVFLQLQHLQISYNRSSIAITRAPICQPLTNHGSWLPNSCLRKSRLIFHSTTFGLKIKPRPSCLRFSCVISSSALFVLFISLQCQLMNN